MKHIINVLFLLFFTVTVFGQTRRVTGVVKDATDGSTLPGVTVIRKGTLFGLSTDLNGEFSIEASPTDTLIFSFIGKQPNEVIPGQRSVLEVVLYDDATQLEEVVIQAFGTTKKASNVASIETVRASDLRVASSNLTSALGGRIAGVISFQTTGEPGADNAEFYIRGISTFGYKKDPLILIDGFEATANDLARLSVDHIESFSVMKDASATVMYGARSANGIISVVTKAGREGPAKINARLDVNVTTPTQSIEFVDGVTYMRLYNEAYYNSFPELEPFYKEHKILETSRGNNPMIYPNVNWYESLFNKYTVNEKFNMDVSGGGQVATYYVAGGYDHESGLLKVDRRNNFNNNINIDRFNVRTNVILKISPTTTLDTRISGRFEHYTGPYANVSDVFYGVMLSNPVDFPFVYEPDEEHSETMHILFGSAYVGSGLKSNPYADMVRGYEDRNESIINAMATLGQKLDFITPGLSFNIKASANVWSKYSSRRTYAPYYYVLNKYNDITGEYSIYCANSNSGRPYLGDVEPGRDANGKYYFEGILRYSREFNVHNVGATIVGIADNNLLTGGNSNNIYETLPERNLGISGRFTYNYDERYFADFSFGYNGSEKFTGEKQFGFFPAFGVGWLISNEAFFEPAKEVVSLLKLKATYGKGGNDAIGQRSDRFFFLSNVSIGSGGEYRWGDQFTNRYGGYAVHRYANPDITWEVSTKWNLGFELGLFNAVTIQGDFFGDIRDKIYWPRNNLPYSAGIEAQISGNVGKVQSHGFDGSVEVRHSFSKDFWFQMRGNFTYATNRIVEIDEENFRDEYLKRKGYSLNQQWAYVAERLFVDEYEIANSPRQDFGGDYQAGDIKYTDVNRDGVVNINDRVPMGYPSVPEMQYGFGPSIGYKKFDFSFYFTGNARVSLFLNSGVTTGDYRNEGIAPFAGRRNALPIIAKNYWTETNPDIYAFWPRLTTEPTVNNAVQSSWWLRDAALLRLKTLEVGYNIGDWDVIGLKSSRVYFICENVLVFSKFKLWDPEMGKQGLRYPPNRRYNIGIRVSF